MKLGTRMRYGTRAMMELARHQEDTPLSVSQIAERQEIPLQYLELLFGSLRAGGLVQSVRGPQGGYLLARPAEAITVRELYEVLEGPEAYAQCTEDRDACERSAYCVTQEVWARMYEASMQVLEATTLADLARKAARKLGECAPAHDYSI